MILDYVIKLLSSTNTLWGIPTQRLITDRKQPQRKTGIAKAKREASIVGINVELDLYEEQKLSGVNTVVLDGKVTIKPQDIEL